MRQFTAFTKKEFMEMTRSGKMTILGIMFVLFGIMNPAIAKLTPWIMETVSDQLADSGMIMTEVKVDALTSWTQFYKNTPMALIIFVLMCGGIFTAEYQKGTLVNVVTKGLSRYKIVLSKLLVLFVIWTVGYFAIYGITYGYNAYFWDNGIVGNPAAAATLYWLGGVWIVTVIPLASAFADNSAMVYLAVGAAYFVPYLIGMMPRYTKYMPTYLMSPMGILVNQAETGDFVPAIIVAVCLICVNTVMAVVVFDKKNI